MISGGLNGINQSMIIQKCRTYNTKSNPNGFTGDDIRDILKDWKQRGLVQCFVVTEGYSKKPTRVWRATEDIKSDRL